MNYFNSVVAAKQKQLPDGTYNFKLEAVEFKSGLQVSFQEGPIDNYIGKENEYNDTVQTLSESTGSDPYLGVYKYEPETSFHTESPKTAYSIAKKYNQESVYNWVTKQPMFL